MSFDGLLQVDPPTRATTRPEEEARVPLQPYTLCEFAHLQAYPTRYLPNSMSAAQAEAAVSAGQDEYKAKRYKLALEAFTRVRS